MAQLTAAIVSHDDQFKHEIARMLRSVRRAGERSSRARPSRSGATPDVGVVDIRGDTPSGMAAIERLRATIPSMAIFADRARAPIRV